MLYFLSPSHVLFVSGSPDPEIGPGVLTFKNMMWSGNRTTSSSTASATTRWDIVTVEGVYVPLRCTTVESGKIWYCCCALHTKRCRFTAESTLSVVGGSCGLTNSTLRHNCEGVAERFLVTWLVNTDCFAHRDIVCVLF